MNAPCCGGPPRYLVHANHGTDWWCIACGEKEPSYRSPAWLRALRIESRRLGMDPARLVAAIDGSMA